MNHITFLNFLAKANKNWYERDINASLKYMDSLGVPKDLWQRSFFQYKCHMYDVPLWIRIVFWIGAFIGLPFVFVYLRIAHFRVSFIGKEECISENGNSKPMIPVSLINKYKFCFEHFYSGFGLSHSDANYLISNCVPYIRDPYFLFHVMFTIAQYSNIIYKYRPDVISRENEYAYSSSILTDYCRKNRILHINIMHGERLINVRNSFFEYDKCYVWHEHYKNMYIRLHANPEQFVVEVPPGLKTNVREFYSEKAFANYKYYLQGQSIDEMRCIVNELRVIEDNGYSIRYRPHPRYTDINKLRNIVGEDKIELPSQVDIRTSFSSSDYVIGSFSTVLLQAYFSGKGVLLDDVTYGNERIELQKKADYILLKVDGPELLSKHINRISRKTNN